MSNGLTRNRLRQGCARHAEDQAREVVIRMPNEIGALNHIARTISDKGVNILAVTAWVEGAQAVIRLVTDDSVRVLER
jgi:hypothetical protein